ncbi:MAG: aminomethyl-transferring glycine dehydrogenase subunit GcvPA [Nitrososphaerota archaeon]
MKKYSHLLPNELKVEDMMKILGINKIESLYEDVPQQSLLKELPKIPGPFSQMEIERLTKNVLKNVSVHPDSPCFLGGGIWPHYIPPAVDAISSRSEFYTSYTPYQPEVSQGILQALFEYQSMICDLTHMDAANASMYDWATAAAEAARMAIRVTKRKDLLVAMNAGYERRRVIQTYLEPIASRILQIPYDKRTGRIDMKEADRLIKSADVAAVYVEQPNFFGAIETSIKEISELVHSRAGLLIVGVEPTSLGLLKPPGDYGADIVVGEGQPLGIPMNYGGPSLGIFAVKGDISFIRQMPGRIIGITTEKKSERKGYVMVLQSREQHIRREKATSNICTNQALMAVRAAAYMALLGPLGFRRLSQVITSNSHYTAKLIRETKEYEAPYFESEFYSDFTILPTTKKTRGRALYEYLTKRGVNAALPLDWFYEELKDVSMISVTEVHLKEDVNRLLNCLVEAE